MNRREFTKNIGKLVALSFIPISLEAKEVNGQIKRISILVRMEDEKSEFLSGLEGPIECITRSYNHFIISNKNKVKRFYKNFSEYRINNSKIKTHTIKLRCESDSKDMAKYLLDQSNFDFIVEGSVYELDKIGTKSAKL